MNKPNDYNLIIIKKIPRKEGLISLISAEIGSVYG